MSLIRPDRIELSHSSILGAIPHGFFGRRGGVSQGTMWGLNAGFGSGDDAAAIKENRLLAAEAVRPGGAIVTVHQIHSANAVIADRAWPESERPPADALATSERGLLLGILTADCAPVLLADADAGVVGAAHAGWRGALSGVTDSVIEAMEDLGATRDGIAATVGPCIAAASYEVDEEFRANFLSDDPDNARFFVPGKPDKHHFDLPSYVIHRLLAAGLGEVEALRVDTYAEPERFFSYRRSTHLGEPAYGRQISLIGLP